MEPLVVARIRAREETDSASAPNIRQDGNTITSGTKHLTSLFASFERSCCLDRNNFLFRKVYQGSSTQDIYNGLGRPLAQSVVDGYNTAILIAGEADAGAQDMIKGED